MSLQRCGPWTGQGSEAWQDSCGGSRYALYVGAQRAQFLFHAFVAAIQVIDAIYGGLALGGQAGDHQAGGGAQVRRHDGGARERFHPGDHGGIAFDIDACAHAREFGRVHVAVFEDGFHDHRSPFSNGVQRHELCLHVGRKTGVFDGAEAGGFGTPVHAGAYPAVAFFDLYARLAQLVENGAYGVGCGAAQDDVAARGTHGTQEGSRFDAVGDDAMGGAVQTGDTVDNDTVGAVPFDTRTHLDEQFGQVHDLGLSCGVFQHAAPLGQYGGHHQVLGACDGDHIGADGRAFQAFGLGHHVAVLDADLRAHGGEAFDVLVHRALANGTAAGQADAGFAEACEQRTKHQDRGAHRLDEFVRSFETR